MAMANIRKTAIENEIEKDIKGNGAEVTPELYNRYKPLIREGLEEIASGDLSDLVRLKYDSSLLGEHPLSNDQLMEHLEKKYGPHFCWMVLRQLVEAVVTSSSKERLQKIVSSLLSDAQQKPPMKRQNETFGVEAPLQMNFLIEAEATVTHQYPQNMLTAVNEKVPDNTNQQIIKTVPQYSDNQITLQKPEQCHDYPYTSTTVSGDSEGSNSSFPYSPGEQEVNPQ